ncbi:hypothetical protein GCM10008119_14200 [Pedobacter mendelii]|uniref:Uncharacterized protein n=1 Tax=Pedobacter mendelii TaxID=1908240 RepID=A0ABQ2BFA9_9SPHI|nr:hypothetical protein [Pedobacter mendelii]GGI24747.1 hypothetical protein GCM10008119_14200 [Pedobacter mendelii]
MAKAIVSLVLIARVVNIATAAVVVAFVQMRNQQRLIPLAAEKQSPQAIAMLGNVKRLPKKERGAKEVLMVMAFAGNMGNRIRLRETVRR